MYLNIDINSRCTPFLNKIAEKDNITKADVEAFLDFYSVGNITDILFCIFCQYSATDSKIWSTYADKYLQKKENGITVDYTEQYKGIYKLNKECGIDPYEVWIKGCRKRNINPWISIRMNDCHFPDEQNSFLRSDFYYEAEEKGWMIGEKYEYFRKNFDYAVPEVRQKMLDYIKEQLERYDVYGVELDFMREIFCFDYIDEDNEKIVNIMNDFIRSVKEIVKMAEKNYGHEIKIAERLTRDIDQSRKFGFDARTWAAEKLVDIIIPSPRWEHSDSMIPVNIWKKELPGVKIIPCIEMLAATRHGGLAFMTAEMVRGIAGGFYSDGADNIYLYNFFGQFLPEESIEIYKTCISAEEIAKHSTRYLVLGQEDATSPARFDPSSDMKPYKPLPIELCGDYKEIVISTAEISDDTEATLIFGITSGNAEDVKLKVNGVSYKDFEPAEIPEPEYLMESGTRCFKCRLTEINRTKQKLLLKSDGENVTVNWIEIDIK